MKTFTILVTYTAEPGMREAFIEEVTSSGILSQIRREDGLLCYNYYRSVENNDQILLVEKWDSEEHQKAHLRQPHMEKLKEIKERLVKHTHLEYVYTDMV